MTETGGQLRLVAPDEPPRLTPGAARALLEILLKAAKNSSMPEKKKERRWQ
ncbi:hypothetical protein ACFOY4_40940 [Actinomadura syzygii]|uniref:hypothetical protein n=1 Tax=Actinomadura syzygii TaxID=1427538 RepID=UPI0016520ACF|nr:hypothetical protein [Actinomadura syzygii]